MTTRVFPVIGQWYERRDKGGLFQVVALDEALQTVEIQEFDGNLDEVDFDTWRDLQPLEAAAPEDWSGPLDDVEPDELGFTDFEATERESLEASVAPWEQAVEEDDDEADSYNAPPEARVHHVGRPH